MNKYLELMRKYKGVLALATTEELQSAWADAERLGLPMVDAIQQAKYEYYHEKNRLSSDKN